MATARIVKISKPFRSTWLGRPGEVTEHYTTSNKLGPRVVVHHWDDTGETMLRAIKGDGRNRSTFEAYHSETVPAGADLVARVPDPATHRVVHLPQGYVHVYKTGKVAWNLFERFGGNGDAADQWCEYLAACGYSTLSEHDEGFFR